MKRTTARLAGRIRGMAALLMAVVIYGGLGLAVPALLNWPLVYFIVANIMATLWAAVVLLAWLSAHVAASHRRHLMEWTTELRLLSSEEFEWFVGEMFRREGWTVRETGHQDRADGNIDLELTRPRERVLVQCKRWDSRQVGINEVRKLAGTLMKERLPGTAGILVTLSRFSGPAIDEAGVNGITLLDSVALYSRVQSVRRSEPCPLCSEPMLLGRSQYGWWFRCVSQGCAGKRDLGNDPGRAVELLTMMANH